MRIVAVGVSRPNQIISNADLLSLGVSPTELELTSITSRCTVRPLPSLAADPAAVPSKSLEVEGVVSPTHLGVQALLDAVAKAGIEKEEIGLVVGETSSQLETIPCESQRVLHALGLKVRAFDFGMSAASFITHLNVIASWRPSRLPRYVACLSVHTPTRFINYGSGMERIVYGDAAAVVLLDMSSESATDSELGLTLSSATLSCTPMDRSTVELGLYSHIKFNWEGYILRTRELMRSRLDELKAAGELKSNDRYIFPLLDTQTSGQMLIDYGISAEQVFSSVENCGFSLGAYPGATLGDSMHRMQRGQRIRVFCSDAGATFGESLLTV